MGTSRLRRGVAVLAAAALAAVGAACSDDDGDDGDGTSPSSTASTAAPTTSTTTGPTASSLSIVAGRGLLLGWWDGKRWVPAEPDQPTPVKGGETYVQVRLGFPPDESRGGTVGGPEEFCGVPPLELEPATPIAVHGVDDPRPRDVTMLDPQSGTYRDAARQELAELELDTGDLQLVQVARVDLEGDGRDEVLVVAEDIADPKAVFSEPGDYSVVFLRRVVDEQVETTTVAVSRNTSTPESPSPYILQHRIDAIADLNGDGRLEVVIHGQYYEGSSTSVHEVGPDGDLVEVLVGGCGV